MTEEWKVEGEEGRDDFHLLHADLWDEAGDHKNWMNLEQTFAKW